MDTIRLQDAIRSLRSEIMEAAEEASTQAVRFEVGVVDLEFQVVAKREASCDSKIAFHIWLVDANLGGGGKLASETTQKVRITLNPVLIKADGGRAKIDIGRHARNN